MTNGLLEIYFLNKILLNQIIYEETNMCINFFVEKHFDLF